MDRLHQPGGRAEKRLRGEIHGNKTPSIQHRHIGKAVRLTHGHSRHTTPLINNVARHIRSSSPGLKTGSKDHRTGVSRRIQIVAMATGRTKMMIEDGAIIIKRDEGPSRYKISS